jgi:purine nucleoside permease
MEGSERTRRRAGRKYRFAGGPGLAGMPGMRAAVFSALTCIVLAIPGFTLAQSAGVIRPKVVVVTMFEAGADTGDQPGEFQFWVEREKLNRVWPFPQG